MQHVIHVLTTIKIRARAMCQSHGPCASLNLPGHVPAAAAALKAALAECFAAAYEATGQAFGRKSSAKIALQDFSIVLCKRLPPCWS